MSRTSLMVPRARRGWLGSLALVPGAVLPLLPSVTCPFCLAAYTGFLSAVGMSFLSKETVLAPLIAAFLLVGIASVAWSTRSHRRPGPLVATILGALLVAGARLVWRVPTITYVGAAVLIGASLWNLWLKRPVRRDEPLVKLRLGRSQGDAS